MIQSLHHDTNNIVKIAEVQEQEGGYGRDNSKKQVFQGDFSN